METLKVCIRGVDSLAGTKSQHKFLGDPQLPCESPKNFTFKVVINETDSWPGLHLNSTASLFLVGL